VTGGAGIGASGRRTETLDGLRGIAVIAVVLQHAWSFLLPGGFAGVDVFFVLSGYLITGLLLRDLRERGSIDLVGFYARRVRRIIPAALICIVATWILYTLLLGPVAGESLRVQATAATLSVSNFLFANDATDYFAADPAMSPYLHFWSLAVEEQFYLVWPSLLLIVALVARRLAALAVPNSAPIERWLPILVLAGAGVVSLVFAMRGKVTDDFYLLPSRAWELIAGGLLAFVHRDGIRLPASLAPLRIVGVVAGALALAAVFFFAPEMGRWPGPGTIVAVGGSALLVAGGDTMPGADVLRWRPLRFFGRISYSLYLWHWPLLASTTLLVLPAASVPTPITVAAVLAAIGLATASTFLVEEPIRISRAPALQRRRAILGALSAVGVVALSITLLAAPLVAVGAGDGVLWHALATVGDDRERLIADACYSETDSPATPRNCVYGAGAYADGSPANATDVAAPRAVLFGDSHAMHWFPLVDAWSRDHGIRLVPLVRSACAPVVAEAEGTTRRRLLCREWQQRALERIAGLQPSITFVSASSNASLNVGGRWFRPRRAPERYAEPLAAMLRELRRRSASVVLLGDVPLPGFSVPRCLAVHRWDPRACEVSASVASPPGFVDAERTAADHAGAAFAEPGPWLCPAGTCTWLVGDRLGWRDDHHITASAALFMRPELEPLFNASAGIYLAPPATYRRP
jgi:peptidoglycan/LPS O-acetylase OafA/YrhL